MTEIKTDLTEPKKTKYSQVIKMVVLVVCFVVLIFLTNVLTYTIGVKNNQQENQTKVENIIKRIQVENTKKEKFTVTLKQADKKILDKNLEKNYLDFLIQYNQNQAQWLNAWLTIMAIALAFLGLISPVCFMKLYEDRKNEMDKIIEEAKEQKKETQINVNIMQKQLEEVNKKEEQMTKELEEVKGYVSEVKSESLLVEAQNKYRNDQYDEAIELLYTARKFNNKNFKISFLLGECFRDKNLLEKAIELYSDALTLNKNNPITLSRRAFCYAYRNEIDKAERDINLAIKLEPQKVNYQLYKALFLSFSCNETDNQKAINMLKSFDIDNINAMGLNVIGFAYIKLGILDKAESSLLKSIEIDRIPAIQYYNLCKIYILQENYNKALNCLKKYVKYSRKDVDIFDDDCNFWIKKLKSGEKEQCKDEILKLLDSIKIKKRYGDDYDK